MIMAAKFLIDAQLPPALVPWLVAQGHTAQHVSASLAGNALDIEIAKLCADEGYILISKDEDFGRLSRSFGFTFVWLRIGNATNPKLFDWLDKRWPQIETHIENGDTFIEVQ
jgi:predicted nuclease of predicted toxin-antitoxin system